MLIIVRAAHTEWYLQRKMTAWWLCENSLSLCSTVSARLQVPVKTGVEIYFLDGMADFNTAGTSSNLQEQWQQLYHISLSHKQLWRQS